MKPPHFAARRRLGLATHSSRFEPVAPSSVSPTDRMLTRASRNLAVLYDAGILKLQREGLWALYSIDRDVMRQYVSDLVKAVGKALENNEMVAEDRERLRKAERVGPGTGPTL